MVRAIAMSAGVLALAGCAPVEGSTRPDPTVVEPAVKVLGEAEQCILRSQIRNTRVRSDQVIDFEMRGSKIYRSTLPNRCPRLGFEEAFTYNTSINQLCNTEVIFVLETVGPPPPRRGAGCGLGMFVPVEYVEDE